jgi:hypothetical protein
MKKIIQLTVLVVLLSLATGCATPYMTDRGRDAADVFTATVGYGIGGKAQIGPIQTGLFANRDCLGLRGGTCAVWDVPPFGENDTFELDLFICRMGIFNPNSGLADKRHKDLMTVGLGPITWPFYMDNLLWFGRDERTPYHHSQIEVAVGVGPSIRLGFNPGELLDFILGWTAIDVFDDDLEKRKTIGQEASRDKGKPRP